MSTIDHSGRHLLALINDVLDLSRVDRGRLELNLTEFSVYKLCQQSVQMVKEMALRKHQALRIETSPSTMQMVGDYRRILGDIGQSIGQCRQVYAGRRAHRIER